MGQKKEDEDDEDEKDWATGLGEGEKEERRGWRKEEKIGNIREKKLRRRK